MHRQLSTPADVNLHTYPFISHQYVTFIPMTLFLGWGQAADAPAAVRLQRACRVKAPQHLLCIAPPSRRRQLAGFHGALLLRAGCHPVHWADRQDGHYPLLFVLSLRFPETTPKHLLKLLLLSPGCICLAGFGLPGSEAEYKVIRGQCLATSALGRMLVCGSLEHNVFFRAACRERPAKVPVLRRSKWSPMSSAARQQLFNVIPNEPPEWSSRSFGNL